MQGTILGLLSFVLASSAFVREAAASAAAPDSCNNRCDAKYDSNRPCQCNSYCVRSNDCCSDYQQVCAKGNETSSNSCQTVPEVTQQLWLDDINRFEPSEIILNYQAQVASGTKTDLSSKKLFSSINEQRLQRPTYAAYLSLLNNYDPAQGQAETDTAQELAEVNSFLDAILATKVMDTLKKHLLCKGLISSYQDLRSKLTSLWFDGYSRSSRSNVDDTSGFEHVMVGEYKTSSKVNGFHGWLSFYMKEQQDRLNYFGYVRKLEPGLVAAAFDWNGHVKTLGSFFVGTSPEFDMAYYSLCFLTNPNARCNTVLDGHSVGVQTYRKDSHIATAFPVV